MDGKIAPRACQNPFHGKLINNRIMVVAVQYCRTRDVIFLRVPQHLKDDVPRERYHLLTLKNSLPPAALLLLHAYCTTTATTSTSAL
jgi:hypothetical protein